MQGYRARGHGPATVRIPWGGWVGEDQFSRSVIVEGALKAVEKWRPSWEYTKVFGDDARHRSIETTSIAREMLRHVMLQRRIYGTYPNVSVAAAAALSSDVHG